MKVRKASFVFKNVVRASVDSNEDEWRKDLHDFKEFITTQPGIYPIGPVFFTISDYNEKKKSGRYNFYIPMNLPINFKGNESCSFVGDVDIKECLAVKQIDFNEDITKYYRLLNICARENDIDLEDVVFHVYLENYGVEVLDIFIPIAAH